MNVKQDWTKVIQTKSKEHKPQFVAKFRNAEDANEYAVAQRAKHPSYTLTVKG